jgi:hypothetical protein
MPSQAHHRSRVIGTAGAALAHIYLAVLGTIGYLNYTVPTRYEFLYIVADQWAWSWIHGAIAMFLLASLLAPYRRVPVLETTLAQIACSCAFAVMLTWAFFNALWGLSTIRPVSLAAPGLAIIVAVGEQVLAHAWNRGATTRDR